MCSTGVKETKKSDTGAMAPLVACAIHGRCPQCGHLIQRGANMETMSSKLMVGGLRGRMELPVWAWRAVGVALCIAAVGYVVGCGGGYSAPPPPPSPQPN